MSNHFPIVTDRLLVLKGRKFDFMQVTLQTPAGKTIRREVVKHPGAVVIVPVLDGGRLALIKNFRHTVGQELFECPAGTIEVGEPPEVCAPRELIEETGYRAGTMISLGSFFTTPGLTDELMHAFVATDLTHVGQKLEEDETIQVVPTPIGEALAMIDRGQLKDAKSMLAILIAHRRVLLGV